MEFLDGAKVSTVEKGSAQARALITVGLEATFKQIFEDGLVHGDPHPGNLLVLPGNELGLIDFGLVARLTPAQQDTLVNLLVTIVTGDIDGIARTVLRMGKPMARINMGEFREAVEIIRTRHLKRSLAELDAALFVQDLLEAGQRFRIRILSEYAILAKATITVEGVLRSLDPDIDLITTAKPFAVRLMQGRFSPRRVMESSVSGIMSLGAMLRDAPQQVDQLLMDLNTGNLQFEIKNPRLDDIDTNLNVLTTRITMAIIASGLFIAAALLVRDDPWQMWGIPFATVLAWCTAVFLSLVGLGWHAVAAGSGKLSLGFLAKLLRKRRAPPS